MPDQTMLTNSFLHLKLNKNDVQRLRRIGVTNWDHVRVNKQSIKSTLTPEKADILIKGISVSTQMLLQGDFAYFFDKLNLQHYFMMWDTYPIIGYFRVTAIKDKIISICLFDGSRFDDFQSQTKIEDFRKALRKYSAIAYFDFADKRLMQENGIDFSQYQLFHLKLHLERINMYQGYTATLKSIATTSDVYDLLSDSNKRDIFEELNRQIQRQNDMAKSCFLYIRAYETVHLLDVAFVIAQNDMQKINFQTGLNELQINKKKHLRYKTAFFAFYADADDDKNKALIKSLILKMKNKSQTNPNFKRTKVDYSDQIDPHPRKMYHLQ